jgi:LmbE family N-acetylglucosaminyl deacetylase
MTGDQFPKSVLAVGAHPDDLELFCGGTLAKYAKMGVKVSMAVSTNGSAGHLLFPPKELAEIRHHEAEKAAKLIGADLYWLGFMDAFLFEDIDSRQHFIEVIRKAKPELIITPDPQDYHPDHRAVSRLMFDASFESGLKNLSTESPFHPGVQPLVYMDNTTGAGFEPTEFVDITDTFKIKHEMLACHESQIKWLKDHDNVDFFDMMETLARARGYQCGVEKAEAFRGEIVWPRAKTYRVLP